MKIFRKIVCRVRGHKYRVVQEFSPWSRRVQCPFCGGDWGMNDNARAMVDWSLELAAFYEEFGHLIREKA